MKSRTALLALAIPDAEASKGSRSTTLCNFTSDQALTGADYGRSQRSRSQRSRSQQRNV